MSFKLLMTMSYSHGNILLLLRGGLLKSIYFYNNLLTQIALLTYCKNKQTFELQNNCKSHMIESSLVLFVNVFSRIYVFTLINHTVNIRRLDLFYLVLQIRRRSNSVNGRIHCKALLNDAESRFIIKFFGFRTEFF